MPGKIQDINWLKFAAKANGKEQAQFEFMCYLLFCKFYEKPHGIERLFNQAGIETKPIKVDDDYIGFQAKFFDTPIASNKKLIKDGIKKAKETNSELTVIRFYCNKDFGQDTRKGKGGPSAAKEEIEKYALKLGVTIDWHLASNFESEFVTQENYIIAEHFFSDGPTEADFVHGIHSRTKTILDEIQTSIPYANQSIKVDRSASARTLRNELRGNLPVLLSGVAGVGKTALIKDFQRSLSEDIPFFVFKAAEFINLANLNALVDPNNKFTFDDFLEIHDEFSEKYIIIDSAEKLDDLEDNNLFNGFIGQVLKNGWKVVFTTRRNYLDDLSYLLLNLFSLKFKSVDIEEMSSETLKLISEKYKFNLPSDSQLKELLRNPFYLNEYLSDYARFSQSASKNDFKDALWDKRVANRSNGKKGTDQERENTFIEFARRRANDGSFYVKNDGFDLPILGLLQTDELIAYDKKVRSYFIAHDIYEEWALEKFIEATFLTSEDSADFYSKIGSSLPVRRAYKSWLSNKLIDSKDEVQDLVNDTINGNNVEAFWKDEVLTALLSDDKNDFLDLFKDKLLVNDAQLLIKVIFLLRIACKDIDESLLKLYATNKSLELTMATIYTIPRGMGWHSIIAFIDENKEVLGLSHSVIITALLLDWTTKNKTGEATKHAARTALYYYNKTMLDGGFGYGSSSKDYQQDVIKAILQGSREIKSELSAIINDVVVNKRIGHREAYHELCESMLGSVLETTDVSAAIPLEILKLANLFWKKDFTPSDDMFYSSPGIGVEEHFGLAGTSHDYFPSSAFQTPIFNLLRVAPVETLNFIIEFGNYAADKYAESDLSQGELTSIEIKVDDSTTVKQHISARLWEAYRGTHVSCGVLESMYMALEKWLLESTKNTSDQTIETLLLNLLKRSTSASLTAVVMSIVVAYPEKLFRVAVVLLRAQSLLLFDTMRFTKDQTQKSSLKSLQESFPTNYDSLLFENERIEACDDPHRNKNLETVILSYQLFKQSEDETDESFQERQKILWQIFDDYYDDLKSKATLSDKDKTWSLYLARMDRRKMKFKPEKQDDKVLISFEPEIDPELKAYSEAARKEASEATKHLSLMMWAVSKWRNDNKHNDYPQYNDDTVKVVTKELKQILKELSAGPTQENYFDRSTPAYVCAVLVRDFGNELTPAQKKLCMGVISQYAILPLTENYQYQISDGVDASIQVLPLLFGGSNDVDLKILLFTHLFDSSSMGMSQFMFENAEHAIANHIWTKNPSLAESMIVGYLMLAGKYDSTWETVRKESIRNGALTNLHGTVIEKFSDENEELILKAVNSELHYKDVTSVGDVAAADLEVAFELIPYKVSSEDQLSFTLLLLEALSKKVYDDNREDRMNYTLSSRFLTKYSAMVLLYEGDITPLLKPFVDNFKPDRFMSDFFKEFIIRNDSLNKYDAFWKVWTSFYPKIVKIAAEDYRNHYTKSIIYSYLFAATSWRKGASEWHSLTDKEKVFFSKAAKDLGKNPATLYSFGRILNGIGSRYLDDGIVWINEMIKNNANLKTDGLETNTIYYLENVIRKFALSKRHKIKTTPSLKAQVMLILDYLINKGSITAYLIRQDIL